MAEKETFNKRLMDAMADMVNPQKSKTATVPTKSGGSYQYNYESLDEVLGIVRPALLKHGLMLSQGMRYHEPTESFVLETGVFDDDEKHILDTRMMPNCSDAQQAGSWETYMRRYALRTAFGLTGEDDDGAATLGKGTSKGKMMTEKQQYMLMSLIEEFADLRHKHTEDVIDALMKTKALEGANFETFTTKQASTAIEQMKAWKEKALSDNCSNDDDMADSDIEF